MPKVFIAENPQPNAFATGRSPQHAAVCVTSGLLARVNNEELAGVIAHELGHVKNRDTLTMTITAVIAGAIGMLANFAFFMGGRRNPLGLVGVLLVTLLAPLAAMLVQAAISRSREFEADRAGAELTGRPLWLADALEEIDRSARQTLNAPADANPATAHMFIVNPLHGGDERTVRQPSFDGGTHRAAARHGRQRRPVPIRSLGMTERQIGGWPRARPRWPSAPKCCASIARSMPNSMSSRLCAPRDAGFARALASQTLRHFGELDAVDPAFRAQAACPPQGGTGDGDPAAGRLRDC